MTIHITRQFSEEHPKQIGQERSSKVQPLLPKVVTVIQLSPFHGGKEEPVYHVAKKVRLL
jgi:hypothetical protein